VTLPSVAVGVRVLNGGEDLGHALESTVAQDYSGPVTVRVRVDAATTDDSLQEAKGAAALSRLYETAWAGARPYPRKWVVTRSEVHETLFRSTYQLEQEVEEDYLFLCDHDNLLYPDRVRASIEGCLPGKGVCLSPVESMGTEGKGPMSTFPRPDFQRTRQMLVGGGNFGDSLTQRLRMSWVRSALLPVYRKVLDLGFAENASEDFLTMLVAAHMGEICEEVVPAHPVAEYRYREGALTKTSNMYSRDARTLCAYWVLADSGELGPPKELLHSDLLATIPRSRGGTAPG
jgi:glycosyltransferase involved in cell wall biosynthesis